MAHTREYLTENHQFSVTCTCPVSREMMITFQFNSDESSAVFYEKIRQERDYTRRKLILLIEMAKTPYEIEFNEGFVMPLHAIWHSEN